MTGNLVPGVFEAREQYGADIVQLIVESGEYCG
jgi:hypothetical protein